MRRTRSIAFSVLAGALALGVSLAQPRFGRQFRGGESGPIVQTEGGELVNEDTVRTARETAPHSIDLPIWTNRTAIRKGRVRRSLGSSSNRKEVRLGWVGSTIILMPT